MTGFTELVAGVVVADSTGRDTASDPEQAAMVTMAVSKQVSAKQDRTKPEALRDLSIRQSDPSVGVPAGTA